MKLSKTLSKEYFSVELYKYIASVLLACVMGIFISAVMFKDSILSKADSVLIPVIFSLIYFVSILVISRLKNINLIDFLVISAGLAAVVVCRVSMLQMVSMDYHNFIRKWLESMSNISFSSALSTKIGDYNLPYLYFLAILSRFKDGWLVCVKALSCVFDVILAYYVMKIASLKVKSSRINAFIFVLTLALPTVLLNSASWGQCDSIYGAFCIGSIYYAFTNKGTKSMVMFALAFAFKLQAIFIIPILLVCFILQKIDWYKLLIVPIVYIACMFPAIVCGRGLYESLFVYVDQASQTQYQKMTLNATSIWTLFEDGAYSTYKWVGIMLAALVALVYVYLCYVYADRIETKELVIVAYLTALALPFFLPSMHDRYFFIADVLSVLVFVYDRRKWYVPLVTVLASFATYAVFLINVAGLYNLKVFTVALMVVMIILTKELFENLSAKAPVRAFKKAEKAVDKEDSKAEESSPIVEENEDEKAFVQ